jgi:hypothetical protein
MADKQTGNIEKQKTWAELTLKEKTSGLITLIVLGIIVVGIFSTLTGRSKTDSPQTVTSATDTGKTSEETPVREVLKGIAGGNYKVGVDMPAGEYVIAGSGYLQIASDSTGSFESIVENDNYSNRTIVVVSDGQYIEFSGQAYTWNDAPKIDTSTGTLPSGKYKVGIDIPAGEYKIAPGEGSGYLQVASTASDRIDSIVSNDNFTSQKYVTISNGQYLKFTNATLNLN